MGTEVESHKQFLKNACSENVRFDVPCKMKTKLDADLLAKDCDVQISRKKCSSLSWELDVKPLISSNKWLQSYGLKKSRLTMRFILPAIGFKLSDDFDDSHAMKRPISSRYGSGLYSQLMRPDGKTFNVTGNQKQLMQIKKRLEQAVMLYKRRLEWLTSESRRVFGVVEEKAVTIVLDIHNMSPHQFDQYRSALEAVLKEQISQVSKFNLIRAAEDSNMFSEECVPVTHDTVEKAVQWLWQLDRLAPLSSTSTCEAILLALVDSNNEAVYLFTEGSSIDTSRELLKEKVSSEKLKIPVHVVSYNCSNSDTIRYLRNLAAATRGRFHAYAVVMEMDAFEPKQVSPSSNKANIVLKKKTFGGLPPGVGVSENVILLFEELEKARNILEQISSLLPNVTEPRNTPENKQCQEYDSLTGDDEQSMSSAEWIKKFGLQTQKLGLFDILSCVAFKHQDGVVDIMEKPDDFSQTDAVCKTKLVNARYCDQFPVVRWRDGSVVHVQVTPEIHRNYEERMGVALQKIQQRIDWLSHGSRELFGTILEDDVYILLDCSASMQGNIQFVKEKLFLLMQEQLRHKCRFNFVSFNSKCCPWRDHLVEVNERNLQSAWAWVQGLTCWGSTNTYGAIKEALEDPNTQAMYLLTDGRPDQPPKSIIAQVQLKNQVPVHTISFNCNDKEANQFLYELARATCGRYHYFSEEGINADQPDSWESEDVQLLKQELKHGLDSLEQLANLRDECSSIAWRKQTDQLKKPSKDLLAQEGDTKSSAVKESKSAGYSISFLSRPKSAPSIGRQSISLKHSSSFPYRSNILPRGSLGMNTKRCGQRQPLVASHTRTSLLRTLNSCGQFSPSEWLLPETKMIFEKQAERYQDLQKVGEKRGKLRKREKNSMSVNNMSSKNWLKKNGLAAKKLTILDALSPTSIPHRSKYIPILDKHIVSHVFDQIIPLAHVSSRTKQEIRLVSPNAVDLDRYQEEVKKAIGIYKERLDQIVRGALGQTREAGVEISFLDSREQLMKLVEEGTCPGVEKEDIQLLEREIEKGKSFIQQAEDLKSAAKSDTKSDLSSGQVLTKKSNQGLPVSKNNTSILAQIAESSDNSPELSCI